VLVCFNSHSNSGKTFKQIPKLSTLTLQKIVSQSPHRQAYDPFYRRITLIIPHIFQKPSLRNIRYPEMNGNCLNLISTVSRADRRCENGARSTLKNKIMKIDQSFKNYYEVHMNMPLLRRVYWGTSK
jgi:hypothetical protein